MISRHDFAHVGRDLSKVFGEDRGMGKAAEQRREERFIGHRDPLAVHGDFVAGRDLPIGDQPSEVIDAQQIEQTQVVLQSPHPPLEIGLLETVPVVDWISP